MEPAALAWAIFVVSVGGFFYLANCNRETDKKVNNLATSVATNEAILRELKEIKTALVGDLDRKGIVTFVHEHDRDILHIKTRCDKIHPLMSNT